MTRVKNRSRK